MALCAQVEQNLLSFIGKKSLIPFKIIRLTSIGCDLADLQVIWLCSIGPAPNRLNFA
jgi:hypothetical protein